VPGASETTPADSPPATNEPHLRGQSVAVVGRSEAKHPADKVRIRFHKGGALRLLSHHDLMRTFERLLRRAGLPFHRSQGFHPKPRLVFALSLPLGVVGREEVVELELDQALPPEEVHARLAAQAPPGLEILSVRRIQPRVNAQVCRLAYALRIPVERLADLPQRIAGVLAASECWIDRHRPHSRQAARRIDLRPFLADLRIHHRPSPTLEMVLHLTPSGTARPEEVLGLLGLQDLLEAGAVLERTRLELTDELPPSNREGATEMEKGSHEKRDAD
jgi:radical SAM-linked protein